MIVSPGSESGDVRAILSVRDLVVELPTEAGWVRVLDHVSFDVGYGEIVGLVGESGSGKTMTTLSVLGLLPSRRSKVQGEILFEARDLLGLSTQELRRIRGRDIGTVFQDPASSLHPTIPVGRQVAEVLEAHGIAHGRAAEERAISLLRDVRIPDATQRAHAYPFELSGGMQQRVLMAIALACDPKLLLADEPTTALDVTVQAQILEMLLGLQRQRGLAVLFVTHDLSLVSTFCDRVLVMYAGQIVEDRPTGEILSAPRHPYTAALLGATPHAVRPGYRLPTIPVADGVPTVGCRFAPRCPFREPQCTAESPLLVSDSTGRHRCIRADEIDNTVSQFLDVRSAPLPEPRDEILLDLKRVRREFGQRRRIGRAGPVAVAVDEVDLQIRAGETVALVGESGSGKSTTARLALRLIDATRGTISFRGEDITSAKGKHLRRIRGEMQAVFQDPTGSLDPTMTVGEHLGVALRLHQQLSRGDARVRAAELLALVGLPAEHLDRYPYELSGGQRQRVTLARALAAEPRLVVLDEPVSSLDVSTQSQAVNLLADLQRELDVSYLLIAHDLPLVRHLSHRVAVMYLGAIVEEGAAEQIYERPRHPYTQALLSLVPGQSDRSRILLSGETPPPTDIPTGCRFRTRCPYVFEACVENPPDFRTTDGGRVQCHLHTSGPRLDGGTVDSLLDESGHPARRWVPVAASSVTTRDEKE